MSDQGFPKQPVRKDPRDHYDADAEWRYALGLCEEWAQRQHEFPGWKVEPGCFHVRDATTAVRRVNLWKRCFEFAVFDKSSTPEGPSDGEPIQASVVYMTKMTKGKGKGKDKGGKNTEGADPEHHRIASGESASPAETPEQEQDRLMQELDRENEHPQEKVATRSAL